MAPVAIVTDSTAYIPNSLVNQLSISVAPLQVIWGNTIYKDGIDMQPSEFYERLAVDKVTPTTSQATPAQFIEIYSRLLEEGYDILSIHISGKLSGTMDSATQARNIFPSARIELVDSYSTSMAMGFQVITTARAAQQGATLQECKALAEEARKHTGVLFLVDTLEFLRRGGRIGGAAAFLGTAFNVKPILELRDGRIEPVEKVRTRGKALERMLDILEERIDHKPPIRLAALHANAMEDGQTLLERARARFSTSEVDEIALSDVSPAIGVHAGPGTLGICYMAGM